MMPTPPFSLLIKPAGPDCNLACEYCFYTGKKTLFAESARHRMSPQTLATLIHSYMQTRQPQHTFGWQGGEPTLMGLDFFRQVTELQQQYGRAGDSVANGLQTNATLIDDAFAAHLARYHFLLGVSLDGPAELHDRYRQRAGPAGGSHALVQRGIACLKRHHVEFNILVLVSQANVRHAKRVYRYLCDQGFLFHQYIPCVEFDPQGRPQPYSISGPEWGQFLCELHDAWHPADTRRVSIRHVDSLVTLLVTGQRNVCSLGASCCQYLVVEHDGSLYPCDFFVDGQWRLGNVADTTWSQALASPLYRAFGARKTQWHAACATCRWRDLCMGDCVKHRWQDGHPDSRARSVLCDGLQRYYTHAMPDLHALAAALQREPRR